MRRVLLAGFAASLVMMVWGTFFWMVLPEVMHPIKAAPNEDSALALLARELPVSGVYVLPYPPKDLSDKAFVEKHTAGPIVQVFYRTTGVHPLNNRLMLNGWLHAFLSTVLLAGLVRMARQGLRSYQKRWIFVTLTGAFATIAIEGLYPIWWHHPWGFHVAIMFNQIVGWMLAGLVIAGIVKAKRHEL